MPTNAGTDIAAFTLFIEILNLPPGSKFNKNSMLKADVTQVGMQYRGYQTVDCPENSMLIETLGLVELYDYDTILTKRWTAPRVELGAYPDNWYCTQHFDVGTNVIFYINKVYNRSSRYPDSIVDGFTKIGGLLAIFRIGILLSFFHQSMFEKKLVKRLE